MSCKTSGAYSSRNDRLAICPNTSTRRNSLLLMAVLFTAPSSGGCSLGDIFIEVRRGHYQRGSTGKFSVGWKSNWCGGKGRRRGAGKMAGERSRAAAVEANATRHGALGVLHSAQRTALASGLPAGERGQSRSAILILC